MAKIEFSELPIRKDFIGKPIKEHGVDIEYPLSRFEIKNGVINIYVKNDGKEECLGSLNTEHCDADICDGGNLYMSGSNCPTFILYMS